MLSRAGASLPFEDDRDFEEQRRGLIAPMTAMTIPADAGHVAWDMQQFRFLDERDAFASIHPSLVRISRLNNNYGLYEVVSDIYQVRGFDLSDLTLVRGKSGWIVFDPLVSRETARAAWALVQRHVGGDRPITAVIYSHTHGDHRGGVRGLVEEEDVRFGRVPVIAPAGFMTDTDSENVYAGNAMNQRLIYQYGLLLPSDPHGYVGQGLGQRVSVPDHPVLRTKRVEVFRSQRALPRRDPSLGDCIAHVLEGAHLAPLAARDQHEVDAVGGSDRAAPDARRQGEDGPREVGAEQARQALRIAIGEDVVQAQGIPDAIPDRMWRIGAGRRQRGPGDTGLDGGMGPALRIEVNVSEGGPGRGSITLGLVRVEAPELILLRVGEAGRVLHQEAELLRQPSPHNCIVLVEAEGPGLAGQEFLVHERRQETAHLVGCRRPPPLTGERLPNPARRPCPDPDRLRLGSRAGMQPSIAAEHDGTGDREVHERLTEECGGASRSPRPLYRTGAPRPGGCGAKAFGAQRHEPSQYRPTRRAVRRDVRRATPATLVAVAGRPIRASARDTEATSLSRSDGGASVMRPAPKAVAAIRPLRTNRQFNPIMMRSSALAGIRCADFGAMPRIIGEFVACA